MGLLIFRGPRDFEHFVHHYNDVAFIAPSATSPAADFLAGRRELILAECDRKLEAGS